MLITKILAATYFCILLFIIHLANQGELYRYIAFYRDVPYGDVIGHFFLMGTLSFFANSILKVRTFSMGPYRIQWGSLWVLIFVVVEECAQIFIVTRTFSLLDLGSDFAGIVFFGYLARLSHGKNSPDQAG